MDTTRFIVELGPSEVELVVRTMLDLARQIATFRATIERYVKGSPEALLLVEFAGDEQAPLLASLDRLEQMLGDHGRLGAVVRMLDPKSQGEMTAVRKAGLNIMMSVKGDGKPISVIEDWAGPLADPAGVTDRRTQ